MLKTFYSDHPELETYRFAIDSSFREKAHILTPAEESIMAQYSEITGATNNVFSMLNNADMRFAEITDEKGEKVELTHGRFIGFMESRDRRVRKEAFEAMYAPYKSQINTLAALYNYNTKTDVVQSRLRNYPSSLDAALSGDNIQPEVYFNLVETVNQNLDPLLRYVQIRKKLLGLDELHLYDIYVPLFELPDKAVSYEEGVKLMKKGLGALGPDYLERMEKGVRQGWVDVYENEGKTSGAYSFGSYDSMPYILMNYNDKLKDVFTLAHEMGHSMHSLYTRETQPFIYGGHSIFTAEVASTVNEALLMKQMIADEKDPQVKKYLLNLYIEEFRSTVFRQTMFAEFELLTHNAVENGEALTSDFLCREYLALVKKYFGPDVVLDEEIQYEWSRIPHFYNAFYVYKYATGFSAAAAISKKILEEGPAARDAYIEFLRSGESNYPIELLKIAGVDMSRPEPIADAMKIFSGLIDELEALI
jgi:oligoendopeptidase F